MNLPTDQRATLFNQAAAAHANQPGYYSLDYYAPKYGETRFGASAETAPIFGVAPVGGKAVPGIGGNYGYHNLIYDAKGNLVSKVGHGDSAAPGSMDVRYFGGSDDVIAAATASPQQPTLSTLPQVSPQISQVDIAGKFAPILNETLSTPSRGMSGQLGDLFTQDYDTQYGLNAPVPYDIRDDQSVMEFVMAQHYLWIDDTIFDRIPRTLKTDLPPKITATFHVELDLIYDPFKGRTKEQFVDVVMEDINSALIELRPEVFAAYVDLDHLKEIEND